MKKTHFEGLVDEAKRSNPRWFLLEREQPAMSEEVISLERTLGLHLDEKHIDFLKCHGSGLFGFANILSVRGTGANSIAAAMKYVGNGFVPAIDCNTGDFYGFLHSGGMCSGEISYWDHDEQRAADTGYADFYELVAALALRQ